METGGPGLAPVAGRGQRSSQELKKPVAGSAPCLSFGSYDSRMQDDDW